MPYATKRTYRRRVGKRRPRARKPPAAVRKKTTVKSVARSNWYKTQKLTRKVDYLLNARYGPIQTHMRRWHDDMSLRFDYPIVFDVTDFTSARQLNNTTPPTLIQGARIWQGNGVGPNPTMVSNNYWTGAFWASDLFNTFPKEDFVGDTGYYLPLYASYEFDITCKSANTDRPPRVRIDLITHRKKSIPTPGPSNLAVDRIMPWATRNFPNLAANVNTLNGVYFKRLKTMEFTLNNDTAMATGTMLKQVKKFLTIKPKKPIYQMKTSPQIPGSAEVETSVTQYGRYGPYNRDMFSPVWCVISTDLDPGQTNSRIIVNCTSKCKWRDPVGSSGI